jgi:hypothetical protein
MALGTWSAGLTRAGSARNYHVSSSVTNTRARFISYRQFKWKMMHNELHSLFESFAVNWMGKLKGYDIMAYTAYVCKKPNLFGLIPFRQGLFLLRIAAHRKPAAAHSAQVHSTAHFSVNLCVPCDSHSICLYGTDWEVFVIETYTFLWGENCVHKH